MHLFIRTLLRTPAALALAALLLGATSAQATPVTITLSGVITVDGTGGVAGVGTPFDLVISTDDATPDEDPNLDLFFATDPGTADATLIAAVSGGVASIGADASTGDWNAAGTLAVVSLPVLQLPFQVALTGSGLTPNQVLPDYTAFSGGQIVVDITGLAGLLPNMTGPEVIASVNGVAIVPEPALAALLALGLLAVAARRA